MSPSDHGPELPNALSGAHVFGEKKRSNPLQIRAIDNRDDRMEIATLLKHLSPMRRLAFFTWACSVAIFPGTVNLHPGVGPTTKKLAMQARHCDRANEQLTLDILSSCTHFWIDYCLDTKVCLDRLVLMARGKL